MIKSIPLICAVCFVFGVISCGIGCWLYTRESDVNRLVEYSRSGDLEGVKKLINEGVDPSREWSSNDFLFGANALYEAASHGHLEVVKEIYEYDNNVNYVFGTETVLEAAIRKEKMAGDVVEYLKEKGALTLPELNRQRKKRSVE